MSTKKEKRKNKLIICITGPAGSGKTTLVNFLKEKGFCTISADELGHRALFIEKEKVKKIFGKDVCNDKGQVDRKKLKEKLKTEEDWKKLELITHPVIYRLILEEIENTGKNVCVVDAAILFTLGIDRFCDFIIKIEAEEEKLKRRLKLRGMDEEFITKIIKKQRNEYKGHSFDYVIKNSKTLDEFIKTSYDIIIKILKDHHFEIS